MCRNFSMPSWVVFVAFLWLANTAIMGTNGSIVGVKNMLGDKLILNVYCPHIDGKQHSHSLTNGDSIKWKYNGGLPEVPGKSSLLCFFRWNGAHHSLDMCSPSKYTGCESAIWEIKQKQFCRHRGIGGPTNYFCHDWDN